MLGPLVVGMVVWTGGEVPEGVRLRDSKKLTPAARERAAAFLREKFTCRVLSLPAWCLVRESLSLPRLEARVIRDGLRELPPGRAVCDALENGTTSHEWLRRQVPGRDVTFESGADDTYPGVAAASILAKVQRDRAMQAHGERWGEVGSGYPSDPSTRAWLERRASRGCDWPPFVRTHWSTVRRLEDALTG